MNSIKKKICYIAFVLLVFLINGNDVKAWQTGSGGASASVSGESACNGYCDLGPVYDTGVFLYQFVYKPKNQDRRVLGCAVVSVGKKEGVGNLGDMDLTASIYAKNSHCTFINSGSGLYSLSKKLLKTPLNNIPLIPKNTADVYVKEMGLDISKFNEEGSIPGEFNGGLGINSYGYRILIQRISCFYSTMLGNQSYCEVFAPRKQFARDLETHPDGGSSLVVGASYQHELFTTEDDIGIAKAVRKPGIDCNGDNMTPNNCFQITRGLFDDGTSLSNNETGNNLADPNKGEGFNIIGFSPEVFTSDYDYSLDMACTNCKSKNSDSKAIVIQDATAMDEIAKAKNLGPSCNSMAKDYFFKTKAKDVYCREEYHIFYPNANNKIKLQLGRYFTVNASQTDLQKIADSSIPNFAPIKVKKIRECGTDASNKRQKLDQFRNNSEAEFQKCGGIIEMKYEENLKSGYKYLGTLKATRKSYDYKIDDVADSSGVNNTELYQEAVFEFKLPANLYQYIRITDGKSMEKKPADSEIGHYKNVGISNLPISMKYEKNKEGSISNISFEYKLPNASKKCTDSNSKMNEVYDKTKNGNSPLNCSNKSVDNIYKKYTKGTATATEKFHIRLSACAKLHGEKGLSDPNSEVSKCIKETKRQTNKMSNCKEKNTLSGSDNYSCSLPLDECTKETAGTGNYSNMAWNTELNKCVRKCRQTGTKYYGNDGKEIDKDTYEKTCCKSTSDAKEMGRIWDTNKNICCEPGTVWAENAPTDGGKTGRCCSPDAYNTVTKTCSGKITAPECNFENHETKGRDWWPEGNQCCPKGEVYDASSHKCVPDPNKACKDKCGGKPCCVDCHGNEFCGKGTIEDGYCPGKICSSTSRCKDGNCNDIIKQNSVYRVFDPSNPFASENNTDNKNGTRDTGDNWCDAGIAGSSAYNCSSNNNPTVREVIDEKKDVSEENALYVVDLTPDVIGKVRSYNNSHEYDDFTLTCDNNGCKSEWLKNELKYYGNNTVSGKCFDKANSKFESCTNN